MTQASEIARSLGLELVGADVAVVGAAPVSEARAGCLVFASRFDEALAARLNAGPQAFVLACEAYRGTLTLPHALSPNPRLDFARAAGRFLAPTPAPRIAETAVLEEGVQLGAGVSVGHYAVIGAGTVIGDGTEVRNHVSIAPGTVIGARCLLKSQSVIGEEGFGFERDEDGRPIRIPHFGRVELEDEVEVGAHTVIARGTLGATRIRRGAKLDDHVFVAHNCEIGEGALVIAMAEVSGSCRVGRGAWIGPNASIRDHVAVGDGALVGIAANVVKPVPAGATVAGNPARPLPPRS
ncbi:MAG: transferase [Planctomycetota bacterium]